MLIFQRVAQMCMWYFLKPILGVKTMSNAVRWPINGCVILKLDTGVAKIGYRSFAVLLFVFIISETFFCSDWLQNHFVHYNIQHSSCFTRCTWIGHWTRECCYSVTNMPAKLKSFMLLSCRDSLVDIEVNTPCLKQTSHLWLSIILTYTIRFR